MSKRTKEDMMKALQGGLVQEKKELAKKINSIVINDDAEEDYNEVRGLLKGLMEKSTCALTDLLELAGESEHPRTYEVLSGLIKTTSELGDQLINLQKQRHELDQLNNPDKTPQDQGTTNVFIGSTDELQKMLKSEQAKADRAKVVEAESIDVVE